MISKKTSAHLFILVMAVFALLVASCSDMGKYPATVANRPPVITSSSSANAIENVRFVYRASATDPDGTAPSISYDSYPAWLSVTGDTISGTPEIGTPDTSFRAIASDGLLLVTLTVSVTVQDTGSGPAPVSYSAQVQPVFTANCAISGCHTMMNPTGGLRLMSYSHLMAGGQSGPVVIPYQPDSSILVGRIEGIITPRMPFNGPPYLPDSTIQTIRTWIAQGALDN